MINERIKAKTKQESRKDEKPKTGFVIRSAFPSDAAVIGWHRARMFQDMGEVPPEMFEPYRAESDRWVASALASGEYLGWLGSPSETPEIIAGGAGVQLRRVPPHLLKTTNGDVRLARGKHAIVLNVFTEPEWRRCGLAALLMREVLAWAQTKQLDRLVLHASAEGRQLYEHLGFVQTNEMRYAW